MTQDGGGVRRQDIDYDTGPKLPMSMSLVPGHVTPRRGGQINPTLQIDLDRIPDLPSLRKPPQHGDPKAQDEEPVSILDG